MVIMEIIKKIILGSLLSVLALQPLVLVAQELPLLPASSIPGLIGSIPLPSVPTQNFAIEAKETGITIFGYRIPLSWDTITIAIAKKFIERMVDSTVKWINTGFEGNPAYATNPKQYFTDIADGVAGEFIRGGDLGFLCSPFRDQIKVSLAQQYYEAEPFQCTLTEILDNSEDAITNFYNDFSKGGWDAWFSMTQNP